jgi:DNA adenine methylase
MLEKPVNTASVPQRSPFRYPGGKTWLVPRLRQWLKSQPRKPREFIEPFAGGGVLSLTVAFEDLADSVTMVELDPDVAAVWKTILEGGAEWLANRLREFALTYENIEVALDNQSPTLWEHGFQTLLKNRINHGGILAPGTGRLNSGENGRGIASRWYPETLATRILNIATVAHKICFIQGDAFDVIREKHDLPGATWMIDPPYTAAGKSAGSRLYTHSHLDHGRLFSQAEGLAGDFLMTYDKAESIQALASRHGFQTCAIPMKNTHHAAMTELLIGRDLGWAKQAED